MMFRLFTFVILYSFGKGDENGAFKKQLADLESSIDEKLEYFMSRQDELVRRVAEKVESEFERQIDVKLGELEQRLERHSKQVAEQVKSELEGAIYDKIADYENSLDQVSKQVLAEPVAFSAYRDGPEMYSPGETVIFSACWVNYGDHYNRQTGIFTCPVAGLYYFSYAVYVHETQNLALELVRDGTHIAAAFADVAWDQGSLSVIIPCNAGNQVLLRQGGISSANIGQLIPEGDCIANSFTGFLFLAL